jgi:hypothetical protein
MSACLVDSPLSTETNKTKEHLTGTLGTSHFALAKGQCNPREMLKMS